MERELVFWRDGIGRMLDSKSVYLCLIKGEVVDGLIDLPMAEIIDHVKEVLVEWEEIDADLFCRDGQIIEIRNTIQAFRFICKDVLEQSMNRIIDVMLEYDCPLYDPLIDIRFDGKPLSLDDTASLFLSKMADNLSEYGFKRQNKTTIQRKSEKGKQGIHIILTKYGRYGNIRFNVFYSYPDVEKLKAYIQGIPYRKGFALGCYHRCPVPNEKLPFDHNFAEGITESEIDVWVRRDCKTITEILLPLLDECNTIPKLADALAARNEVRESIFITERKWTQVALQMYLGKIEAALAIFDGGIQEGWIPTPENSRKPLSMAQVNRARERIASWEVGRKLESWDPLT